MTKRKQPSFKVSKLERTLIELITERAIRSENEFARKQNKRGLFTPSPIEDEGCRRIRWHMDLIATHNSNPLDLERLLAADDFNFIHDVYGIARHIDRETGELGGCFSPRFSRRGPRDY